MPQGLQVFKDGNLIIDLSTRVGRFYASFDTAGQLSGSLTDATIIGKSFLYFAVASGSGVYGGPDVSANTSTGLISWTYNMTVTGSFPGGTPADRQHKIFYGAF